MDSVWHSIAIHTPTVEGLVLPASKALMTGLITLILVHEGIRGTLLGAASFANVLLRTIFIVVCLGNYREIATLMVEFSESLIGLFVSNAHGPFENFLTRFVEPVEGMYPGDSSQSMTLADRFLGFGKGYALSLGYTTSFFLVSLIFDFLQDLSGLVFGILYVLGPLLLVAHLIPGLNTAGSWFRSAAHCLLWPLPAVIFLYMGDATMSSAAAYQNTAATIAQNLIYCCAGLFSPLIIAFILGHSGVSAMATATTAFALKGATAALGAVPGMAGGLSSLSGALAGALPSPGGASGIAAVLPRPDRLLAARSSPAGYLPSAPQVPPSRMLPSHTYSLPEPEGPAGELPPAPHLSPSRMLPSHAWQFTIKPPEMDDWPEPSIEQPRPKASGPKRPPRRRKRS